MPMYQEWEPTPILEDGALTAHTHVYYDAGLGLPIVAPEILFKIKDPIEIELMTYVQFRLISVLFYTSVASQNIKWLNPTCYASQGILQENSLNTTFTTMLIDLGLTYNFLPLFQNLNLLDNGDYQFYHQFILEGKNNAQQWTEISAYQHILELHVSNQIVLPCMTNPYGINQHGFTLDPSFFTFRTDNVNTYFQVDAEIKTFDFGTGALNEFLIPQKIVPFKKKGELNLGQIIHRLMKKFEQPNESYLQYMPATLKLTCSEINRANQTSIRTEIIEEIKFVAGLGRNISNIGFLEFNSKYNRVTVNSFAYLNMLIPEGEYILVIYKNNIQINYINLLPSNGFICCKKILFNDFTPGDIIEYALGVIGEISIDTVEVILFDIPKKTFVIFPEGKHSNTIIWEDEFLVQSNLECTGDYLIKSDFEFITQKPYRNLVETLDILDVSKEVKVTINTGWVMTDDIDSVESLMKCKRAWINQEGSTIDIRPIGKTMINQDSKKELIEYALEFTINRKYNEETYSL